METFCELLDLESGNVLKDFDTQIAALDSLRAVVLEHGEAAIEGLALLRFDGEIPFLIAMQDELVARVRAMMESERVSGMIGFRSST